MKYALSFLLASICMLYSNGKFDYANKQRVPTTQSLNQENTYQPPQVAPKEKPAFGRMSAVAFKNQLYCRAEMPADFEFDARFAVVSATVYFSGANFKNTEKAFITNSSLKPIAGQMARCIPGTIVIFDDVKVIGPDKELRAIPGVSYMLY
jgi:hypothetical protein